MITIAVSSQKGGVGKTTVSINLAHAFAREGMRTLLVDADPQGSVGLSLTRQSRLLNGFYDAITDPTFPIEKLAVPTRLETFSLIPAGQGSDYEHGGGSNIGSSRQHVRTFLDMVERDGYDICIIDTAAGLFGITEDLISTCDSVLIPQQAEPLGVRSVPKMLEALTKMRMINPHINIIGVVMTMVQNNLDESLEAVKILRELLPESMVMRNVIPRDNLFVRASAKGLPVGEMNEGSDIAAIFDNLQAEIETKIKKHLK